MQRYVDTVLDPRGNIVAGAMVKVKKPDGTLATIHANNNAEPSPNPFSTNALGVLSFYAANGRYSVEVTVGGVVLATRSDVILFDPDDQLPDLLGQLDANVERTNDAHDRIDAIGERDADIAPTLQEHGDRLGSLETTMTGYTAEVSALAQAVTGNIDTLSNHALVLSEHNQRMISMTESGTDTMEALNQVDIHQAQQIAVLQQADIQHGQQLADLDQRTTALEQAPAPAPGGGGSTDLTPVYSRISTLENSDMAQNARLATLESSGGGGGGMITVKGYTLATRPSAFNVPEGTVINVSDLPIGTQQKAINGQWMTINKPWILGTDWWTDVDDAVAMRLVHHFEKMGLIHVLGIPIDTNLAKGPGSLEAFMLAEGRDATAISSPNTPHVPQGSPAYQRRLYDDKPHYYTDPASTENAVTMHRRILATYPGKVDIVTIGYLNNLHELLDSGPDVWSPLNGEELVAQKVHMLWAMAGKWPSGGENNFTRTAQSRAAGVAVASRWPTPIVFSGFEVGESIRTGGNISGAVNDHLRNAMFDHGGDTGNNGRSSWDPMKVYLAAICDTPEQVWRAGYTLKRGKATVSGSGYNNWADDPAGKHYYTVKAWTDEQFKTRINAMLVPGAKPFPFVEPAVPGPAPGVQLPPPPVVPGNITGLTVTAKTQTSLTIDWGDSANATHYIVTRPGATAVQVTQSQIVITGLTAGASYSATVTPYNGAVAGTPATITDSTQAAPPVDPEEPVDPEDPPVEPTPGTISNLNASPTHDTIVLTWDGTAEDYTVSWDGNVEVVTANTFTLTGAPAATPYVFSVLPKHGTAATIETATLAEPAPIDPGVFVDEANLFERFQASTLDNGSVTQWLGTKGKVLAPPSAENKAPSRTEQGGYPAVQFMLANRLYTEPFAQPAELSVYTLVWMNSIPSSNATIICTDSGNSTSRSWHLKTTASAAQFVSFVQGGNSAVVPNAPLPPTGQWVVVAGTRAPSATCTASTNGVRGESLATNTVNTNSVGLYVGGRDTFNTETWGGYLNEIRIYSAQHDEATMQAVVAQMLASVGQS